MKKKRTRILDFLMESTEKKGPNEIKTMALICGSQRKNQ